MQAIDVIRFVYWVAFKVVDFCAIPESSSYGLWWFELTFKEVEEAISNNRPRTPGKTPEEPPDKLARTLLLGGAWAWIFKYQMVPWKNSRKIHEMIFLISRNNSHESSASSVGSTNFTSTGTWIQGRVRQSPFSKERTRCPLLASRFSQLCLL